MKIKKYLLFYLILNIFMVIIAFAQDKEEIVTNSVVIDMVKAKLGEAIIINKIRSSKTNFDLSTDALIKLKKAGVSDNIINTMIEVQGQHTKPPTKSSSIPASGDVSIFQYGKLIEMEYVAGFTKNLSSFWLGWTITKTRFAIIASGEHSQMRIKNKNPVFYIKIHPSEISIVKFDFDTYDKKPVRYVTRVGDLWLWTGDQAGRPGKGNIDFDFKKGPNGLYKITLREPLENGEYGIIVAKARSGATLWGPSTSY